MSEPPTVQPLPDRECVERRHPQPVCRHGNGVVERRALRCPLRPARESGNLAVTFHELELSAVHPLSSKSAEDSRGYLSPACLLIASAVISFISLCLGTAIGL